MSDIETNLSPLSISTCISRINSLDDLAQRSIFVNNNLIILSFTLGRTTALNPYLYGDVNGNVYLLANNVISLLEMRTTHLNSILKNQLISYNMLLKIHHIAIICSNYEDSKRFYIDILGLEVINETYRQERDSYKLDLALKGQYFLELFSFPHPPKRPSRPESTGLRHLAFEVEDLDSVVRHLTQNSLYVEPIRIDHITNKRFTFTSDPDDLPIEFYEK